MASSLLPVLFLQQHLGAVEVPMVPNEFLFCSCAGLINIFVFYIIYPMCNSLVGTFSLHAYYVPASIANLLSRLKVSMRKCR